MPSTIIGAIYLDIYQVNSNQYHLLATLKYNRPTLTKPAAALSLNLRLPSPLQKLNLMPDMDLWIKRDDLIHPVVSGNKWRKLAGFIAHLPPQATVLTFGGAHSNHLAAAATCLHAYGHKGIFIVRGQELGANSSSVLQHCQQAGMQLKFIERAAFRQLRDNNWQLNAQEVMDWQLPTDTHILPEGGSGPHNLMGCQQLWQEIHNQILPDHIWLAAGTGGTARGLLQAMPTNCTTKITLVSAVKGAHREAAKTAAVADQKGIQLQWLDETTFGGFAKSNALLAQSRQDFYQATDIPLDPVYNAKVWWHLCHSQPLPAQKVLWIHTGGFRPATTINQ
ncbi:MAG: pyridoxal-phosphate dependent enzyme [Gammaproteobacteria bacterium]|jgi:1-aminocyclopropane-1-carboxylate deaminase|nr:pyridoxal-phosphate dependent enzyme [Gammaproteobacteria bacterium]